MKTLVTYLTKTGNTKKVADAIYETIAGEKEINIIFFSRIWIRLNPK